MACWELFWKKRDMARKDGEASDVPKEDKLHAEIKATQTISLTENGQE